MNAVRSLASAKGANVLTLSAVTSANVLPDMLQPQMAPGALVSKELQTWVWVWVRLLEASSLNPRRYAEIHRNMMLTFFKVLKNFHEVSFCKVVTHL